MAGKRASFRAIEETVYELADVKSEASGRAWVFARLQYALGMRRLLLALVLIPMAAPVYAERNCEDHFAEDAA